MPAFQRGTIAPPAHVNHRHGRPVRQRDHVREIQRMRVLDAMVRVAADRGIHGASVARVVSAARVSRRTFYAFFDDRDDCLLVAIEQALDVVRERANAAYASQGTWADSVRAGLHTLLRFLDEEPRLARLCVVQAPAGNAATLARRRQLLDELATVLDRARGEKGAMQPPSITAQGLVGGALSVIHARLLSTTRDPLTELLNPLMSTIILPYLGSTAARRELDRPLPPDPDAKPVEHGERARRPDVRATRLTYRTLRVLEVIALQPGLANNKISERAGISDQGQISKLLARLAQLGLLENTGKGQPAGAPNAWRLTPDGAHLERTFRREASHAPG
jgi:AcrR family transcriptional regulator